MSWPAPNERGIERLKASLRHLARFGAALGALAIFYSVSIWLVVTLGLYVDGDYVWVAWAALFVGGICITTTILKGMPGWKVITIILSLLQILTSFYAALIILLAANDWAL